MNHAFAPSTACMSTNAATAAIANVNTTGALYVMRSFTIEG